MNAHIKSFEVKESSGLVFDIERFSTADGPGIRTVVFFKGCNMRCYWCHNSEGIGLKPELRLLSSKCISCGSCIKACKSGALILNNGKLFLDSKCCVSCFACTKACYTGALQQIGRTMSVCDVMSEVLEDKKFYSSSSGGITISGGEAMLQDAFVYDLLKACKTAGIHTAIETNLSLPWSSYCNILPFLDLLMCDIKIMNDKMHANVTGISNQRILDNLYKFDAEKMPYIVRTPIIPGFNATKEHILEISRFLKPLTGLLYYELLSYNPLGDSKPQSINSPAILRKIISPSKSEMEKLAAVAAGEGLKVQIDGRVYY